MVELNVTGVGFQPDWLWFKKRRSGTWTSFLFDSVRGAYKYIINTPNSSNMLKQLQHYISLF